MTICKDCQFWSELIARSNGPGLLQALCLSPESPHRQTYTFEREGCKEGVSGQPIDDPDLLPLKRGARG